MEAQSSMSAPPPKKQKRFRSTSDKGMAQPEEPAAGSGGVLGMCNYYTHLIGDNVFNYYRSREQDKCC